MYSKKLYVVMNENRNEIFTHIGWIGLKMEPFNQEGLLKEVKLSDIVYESRCDNYDTIQFFKSPKRAKEEIEKFRARILQKGKKEIGKLCLIELEVQVNQKVIEDI